MVLQEQEAHAPKRGAGRRDLGENVDAVAIVIDHVADPSHLALDAPEPGLEVVLVLVVAAHARRGYPPRGGCHTTLCDLGPSGYPAARPAPPHESRRIPVRRRPLLVAIPALVLSASAIGLAGCASGGEGAAAENATTSGQPAPSTNTAPEPPQVREAAIDMGAPGEFDLAPQPQRVDAGRVSFQVANDGTIEHEVIVMRTDLDSGALPTDASGAALESGVVEPAGMHGQDHHGLHVAAGESATMSVDLSPGEYALICNLPGHYEAGMHANLTVS